MKCMEQELAVWPQVPFARFRKCGFLPVMYGEDCMALHDNFNELSSEALECLLFHTCYAKAILDESWLPLLVI